MKKLLLLLLSFLFMISYSTITSADVVDMGTISVATDQIKEVSTTVTSGGSFDESIKNIGMAGLMNFKIIIGSLIVLFIIYSGIMMVMSMGSDEEKLSSSKKQLYYSLIAFLFINIPGTLYNAFTKDNPSSIIINEASSGEKANMLINKTVFNDTLYGSVISFMEILIGAIALFFIIGAGLSIIMARGEEDKIKEQKNKILFGIMGLITIPLIESWKSILVTGDITKFASSGSDGLFYDLVNLALYFAGPVVIVFLVYAGYIYITADGEEDKTKKAKNIVINTLIGILILLAASTFLVDLNDLSF